MSIYGQSQSPRKTMAMGKGESGASSVKPIPAGRPHPDAKMGMKGEMADAGRAVGMPVMHTAGQMPSQASPDHGPHYEKQMGFMRGPKA